MNIYTAKSAYRALERGKTIAVIQGFAVRLVKLGTVPQCKGKVVFTKLAHEQDWEFLHDHRTIIEYKREELHKHLVVLQPEKSKKVSDFVWHQFNDRLKIELTA